MNTPQTKTAPARSNSARTIKQCFKEEIQHDAPNLLPLARKALDAGENFLAYDIAERHKTETDYDSHERIRIMALALARAGSLKRAAEMLSLLPEIDDSEIIGLKSRILKDMAINAADPVDKRRFFLNSGKLSLDIFKRQHQYYNGINAASCLFMADEPGEAERLVRNCLLPLCLAQKKQDLWLCATLGECYLLIHDFQNAQTYYSKAAAIATQEGQLGNFASTLKQLNMLAGKIGHEADALLNKMVLPAIAIFSGHMIDRPGRISPRFPPYAEEQVRRDLAKIIREKNVQLAFSSCACGGDILFIEEVLKHGGECFVTPPLPMEKTIQKSVDIIPGADWKQRLQTIAKNENVLFQEPECDEIGDEGDSLVYDFANRYILGQALLKQETLHFPICGITVWNGEKSGCVGGTDSAVQLWKNMGIQISIVLPEVRHD